MTEVQRWEPDDQLIASYLAGPRPELDLSPADRSWVVAGLTLAGHTAEDIAERIGRSLRLVRTVRSDPMTLVCMFYQLESATFENEQRLANSQSESLARELSSAQQELARVRNQLNRLIGRTTFGCGHPLDKYNTYSWTDRRGRKKQSCRTCHRKRAAERRKSCQPKLSQPTLEVVTQSGAVHAFG